MSLLSWVWVSSLISSFFFFNDTATTEIYTLSLHDALPIFGRADDAQAGLGAGGVGDEDGRAPDRKSTRLNSSHTVISYAVFCLKKKKKKARSTNPAGQEPQTSWSHCPYNCDP